MTTRPIPETKVEFIGADDKTQGDWPGKYGRGGVWIPGQPPKLPSGVKPILENNPNWIWEAKSGERRAPVSSAAPTPEPLRVASCWYGNDLIFNLDVGTAERKVSLYFLDWEGGRLQSVLIRGMDGKSLDQRQIGRFKNGRYLSWKMLGAAQFEIQLNRGKNAVVSGLFIDTGD